MKLPEIGETVTSGWAVALCRYFGLDALAGRIEKAPDRFKDWVFDGCSCLPDPLLGLLSGGEWKKITYRCCLPHDLAYAYGDPGNEQERKSVDEKFFNDLVHEAGMKKWMAAAFLAAVRVGGAEEFGLSFSWAFARK